MRCWYNRQKWGWYSCSWLTVCWFANWLTDLLADWLTDWLTDWLADWLTDWLADSLTHWLTHSLTSCVHVFLGTARGSHFYNLYVSLSLSTLLLFVFTIVICTFYVWLLLVSSCLPSLSFYLPVCLFSVCLYLFSVSVCAYACFVRFNWLFVCCHHTACSFCLLLSPTLHYISIIIIILWCFLVNRTTIAFMHNVFSLINYICIHIYLILIFLMHYIY